MPFAVWMIKGFIDGIPLDTEEAALVDGSSRLQVIRNIVLPMAAPGLLTAGIFCFIIAWNRVSLRPYFDHAGLCHTADWPGAL